jgi:AcrR family transcriptional regulator
VARPKAVERTYHHGNLRQELLRVSLKLIDRKGIEALTLREIGRLAGVSHNAAYRHFADKQALLSAISESGFVSFGAALEQARESAGPTSRARLAAMSLAYLKFAAEHRAHYTVMFGWAAQPGRTDEVVQHWHEPARHSFEILVDTIAAGQRAGEIRAGDTAALARVVWASVHGLALLPFEGGLDERICRLSSDVLYEGLLFQGTGRPSIIP